ncbi:hypothetical protein PUV54_02205 [Hyphococcus flavus]|uniref:Uncharacterized protein n=1 Tax=Hyphococcus flavus TaxID=1866326 RepID=A0AAE9ZJ39_9PROT|nr:hypothetical protein [Hyphococcus flavus]WDI32001.1 hypothetical protein PUV54_02205 [Hyphococcus flavus]
MIRILLPLAIVAAMFFGPMYSYESDNPVSGREEQTLVTGDQFIGGAINCMRNLTLPRGEDCASDGRVNDSKNVSRLMSWAASLSVGAALIGVLGLLPIVSRLTSVVTLAAGLISLAAMGFFLVSMMGTKVGLGGVQWGAYLTSGAALLTTISGLSGMRGR